MTQRPQSGAAPAAPTGYRWRKIHGLLTWRDIARRWRAVRYTRPGCRSPLPEDILPCWREARP